MKLIKYPINFFSSIFCGRGSAENDDIFTSFQKLPNYTNYFELFYRQIRNKLGILIIYDENEIEIFKNFVIKISTSELILDILVKFLFEYFHYLVRLKLISYRNKIVLFIQFQFYLMRE